jgi:4-hydroxybenzoyl-CoA thioesterase
MPHQHLRPVRFEDVDAAGIVFFARYFNYCHDAMESLFDALEGGYATLINDRHLGLPAVHVECDFRSPLRYGETARIDVSVEHIGTTSATLRYRIVRDSDGHPCATVRHVVVTSDLRSLTKVAIPADVRRVLSAILDEKHV